jgi:hypothetical protein
MCYDADTSRNAFVIGIVSSIALYCSTSKSEYKAVALFLGYVTLMQGFDYLFWTYPKPSEINRVATKAAAVVNWMQPVILYLLLNLQSNKIASRLAFVYFLSAAIYTIIHWNKLTFTEVKPDSAPSLRWDWNHYKGSVVIVSLYLIVSLYFIKQGLGYPLNYLLIAIFAGTYLFSLFKYKINVSYGRFWCYYAAYAPLLLLLILQVR